MGGGNDVSLFVDARTGSGGVYDMSWWLSLIEQVKMQQQTMEDLAERHHALCVTK